MQQYVIIVAGGIGSRMKVDRPKQFLELKGKPVIARSISAFLDYESDMNVIVCVHRNYRAHLEGIIARYFPEKYIQITYGGDTRFQSVKNGLALVTDDTAIVGIHDAARPLVSRQTIEHCYTVAAEKGVAIPCVPVHESLRKISNNVNNSVNRHEYRIVQTPQCFLASRIKSAFRQEYNPSFTDDATVFEAAGERVVLVEGNEENIKLTSPLDMQFAAAMIPNQ